MENRTIDARGLACPLPVVNAKKAVAEFQEEGTLTVLVDNEIAVQNLKKFAAQKGLEASGEKRKEKEYAVTIQISVKADAGTGTTAKADAGIRSAVNQKKEGKEPQNHKNSILLSNGAETPESCYPDMIERGLTVVLSSNMMGNGEPALGHALMKAFIFALTKQDILPETVLCYNSGAYLTCEGSDSLEDFQELEAEGVTIMTCGTCLDFYHLKDELEVGTVTNMYEIVEIMEQAKKIVRP